jgi:ABC-type transport system involved in cytochrome c biogenesis permease subunit
VKKRLLIAALVVLLLTLLTVSVWAILAWERRDR